VDTVNRDTAMFEGTLAFKPDVEQATRGARKGFGNARAYR
jgi:hypothetical protein